MSPGPAAPAACLRGPLIQQQAFHLPQDPCVLRGVVTQNPLDAALARDLSGHGGMIYGLRKLHRVASAFWSLPALVLHSLHVPGGGGQEGRLQDGFNGLLLQALRDAGDQ